MHLYTEKRGRIPTQPTSTRIGGHLKSALPVEQQIQSNSKSHRQLQRKHRHGQPQSTGSNLRTAIEQKEEKVE